LRVSYRWLQDYVKCELPAEELAEELTMVGLEVEGVFPPVEGLDRIIVGKILEIKPHPNAENLMLCRVDTGSDIIQLVSGAPNLKTGVFKNHPIKTSVDRHPLTSFYGNRLDVS
jgi:phenylalanyl-tRNA synthetase beta chain